MNKMNIKSNVEKKCVLTRHFELGEDDDVGDGDGEHPGEARPADGEEPATTQPGGAHPLQLPNL